MISPRHTIRHVGNTGRAVRLTFITTYDIEIELLSFKRRAYTLSKCQAVTRMEGRSFSICRSRLRAAHIRPKIGQPLDGFGAGRFQNVAPRSAAQPSACTRIQATALFPQIVAIA